MHKKETPPKPPTERLLDAVPTVFYSAFGVVFLLGVLLSFFGMDEAIRRIANAHAAAIEAELSRKTKGVSEEFDRIIDRMNAKLDELDRRLKRVER